MFSSSVIFLKKIGKNTGIYRYSQYRFSFILVLFPQAGIRPKSPNIIKFQRSKWSDACNWLILDVLGIDSLSFSSYKISLELGLGGFA